jgi:hypothetical protein
VIAAAFNFILKFDVILSIFKTVSVWLNKREKGCTSAMIKPGGTIQWLI